MKFFFRNNAIFYLFLILVTTNLNSCLEINCDELENIYRNEECIIVVDKAPKMSSWFQTIGYNPYTKKNCECKSVNRWWSQFSGEIEKGDTIIKKSGELTFNIHKKDTIHSHKWECKGKVYK